MFRSIGPTELILILVIVLIVFGVGRLGEVGGALGGAIREFRKASSNDEKKAEEAKKTEEAKQDEAPKA